MRLKVYFTILLLFAGFFATAQSSILLFQKRHKTQKLYYEGSYIAFATRAGTYLDGIITKIQMDTVYLRGFQEKTNTTQYGGVYFDTVYQRTIPIHYKDIGKIIKKRDLKKVHNNGKLLGTAGLGYLLLNVVNGIYFKEKPREWVSPRNAAISGGLLGLGYLLTRVRHKEMTIGRKYQLEMLSVKPGERKRPM
jgi:hypothetical protein